MALLGDLGVVGLTPVSFDLTTTGWFTFRVEIAAKRLYIKSYGVGAAPTTLSANMAFRLTGAKPNADPNIHPIPGVASPIVTQATSMATISLEGLGGNDLDLLFDVYALSLAPATSIRTYLRAL